MKKLILSFILFYMCLAISIAQEKDQKTEDNTKKEKIVVMVKKDQNPDVYIDGVKYDHAIFELLDQSKIESITVLKKEQAKILYDAPNGVILISTKKDKKQTEFNVIGYPNNVDNEKPMVIIDGENSDKDELSKISPAKIKTIVVFTGEDALKKYNTTRGVIVVTTKENKE